jgi:DNA-binding NarL/FixJ family response regulator
VLQEIREEEFRRGIHGQTNRCQVIINTAKDDLDQMIGSLRNDPDGYLIKPINMDLVVEKINTLKAERIGSGERHPCR